MPRREKNNPKTIEQIHREAQEEVQQKHAAMQRASIEQRTSAAATGRRPAGNWVTTLADSALAHVGGILGHSRGSDYSTWAELNWSFEHVYSAGSVHWPSTSRPSFAAAIESRSQCTRPMNASCNWIGVTSVHVLWMSLWTPVVVNLLTDRAEADAVKRVICRELKFLFYCTLRDTMKACLQCFDAVGWAAGRASGP